MSRAIVVCASLSNNSFQGICRLVFFLLLSYEVQPPNFAGLCVLFRVVSLYVCCCGCCCMLLLCAVVILVWSLWPRMLHVLADFCDPLYGLFDLHCIDCCWSLRPSVRSLRSLYIVVFSYRVATGSFPGFPRVLSLLSKCCICFLMINNHCSRKGVVFRTSSSVKCNCVSIWAISCTHLIW